MSSSLLNYPENVFKRYPEYKQAKNNPVEYFDDYARNCCIAIGTILKPYIKIYLDLKYWIYFRDVQLGISKNQNHKIMFDLLCDLVATQKAICPITAPIVTEFNKQRNFEKGAACAHIMDQFSKGIAIRYPNEVFEEEILAYLNHTMTGGRSCDMAMHYPAAYSFSPFVFGIIEPPTQLFSENERLKVAIDFFDRVTNIPFSAYAVNNIESKSDAFDWEEYANKRKALEEEHRNEFSTFEEIFAIELEGTLLCEIFNVPLINAINTFYRLNYNVNLSFHELAEQLCRLKPILFAGIMSRHHINVSPSLIILTGLMAAHRLKNAIPKQGDIFDHSHASIAVPHCDAFFTEKNLGTALTQGPLNYDKRFSCTVLWKDEQIINFLKSLSKP